MTDMLSSSTNPLVRIINYWHGMHKSKRLTHPTKQTYAQQKPFTQPTRQVPEPIALVRASDKIVSK